MQHDRFELVQGNDSRACFDYGINWGILDHQQKEFIAYGYGLDEGNTAVNLLNEGHAITKAQASRVSTHWEGCWRAHLGCAKVLIRDLFDQRQDVSDQEREVIRDFQKELAKGAELLKQHQYDMIAPSYYLRYGAAPTCSSCGKSYEHTLYCDVKDFIDRNLPKKVTIRLPEGVSIKDAGLA